MNQPVDNIFAGMVGLSASILSFVFDIPAPAIFAAFIGSLFAVSMASSVSYRQATKMIVGGTVASGLLCSVAIHYFGEGLPTRGVAALLAFIVVHYRVQILAAINRRIEQ